MAKQPIPAFYGRDKRDARQKELAVSAEIKTIHSTFRQCRHAGLWRSPYPQCAWSQLLDCPVREQAVFE